MAVLQTTEVPVGSAGTPSLTFTGRTNDGIYSPAEDQVAVTTGGTQRLVVGNATLTYNGNNVAVKNADGTLTGADGTSATHYVTKQQLDSISAGYDPKQSCRVATTGSETYTIAGGAVTQIAGTTVDGVTGAVNDRILIKNAPVSSGVGSSPETTQPANGIYIVTNATTNLTVSRASDADVSAEVTGGMYVFVTEGTDYADSGWVLTTNDTITLNTTALNFVQFTGAGQITAGAALTKTGNTLDVAVDNVGIEVNADALRLKDSGVVTAKIADATNTTTGVTFPKMRHIATDRLIGRDTAGTGAPEEISLNATLSFTGAGAIQRAALTGDVTATAGSNATTIANDAVTNAKMANMAQNTIKGRITASTGDPEDLTADNVITIINTGTTDIADARLTANVPLLNIVNTFTKANITTPFALTDGANIALDASQSNVFTVTLAGNRTLDNPTNPVHGQNIVIHVKQDATGGRTLAYGSAWDFKGSAVISTTANAADVITATYNSASAKWFAVLARQDSSAVDAGTLDGLDSTAFLRTNGANEATAGITFSDSSKYLLNFTGLLTTGLNWDTTANQLQFKDAGTTRAYIDLDNGEFSATSIVETSDERLKHDIVNIDGARALKQVKKMQGVYFTRNDTGLREVGLIAQRVKALEPMLVQEDREGYLSVNYTRIVALLIECVKEQQEQIDTLKQEVESVKHGANSAI